MTKKQTVTVEQNSNDIGKLREGVAQAVGSTYGAIIEYAKGLNALFGTLPIFAGKYWWEVKHDDKGSEFEAVNREFDLFRDTMKKNNCKNASVYSTRVKKAGYEHSGVKPAEGAEGAEGEGEGEGAGDKARPIKGRFTEELSKLYKARFSEKYASEITEQIRSATLHIEQALIVLGVNVNDLVN